MTITIRERELKSGKKSLYLDIHHDGNRDYEFLGLYLTGDRRHDKEQRQLASIIKAKRLQEYTNNKAGFKNRFVEANFIEYFTRIAEKNKERGVHNHNAALKHLTGYSGQELRFRDISKKWAIGLQDYLSDRLSQNSVKNYWALINSAINQAVREDIIPENPIKHVPPPKEKETETDYLTPAELETLGVTDCINGEVKRAFFFSCYTGLRISDVRNLQWDQIRDGKIVFNQQKTTKLEYLPLSPSARRLLGDRPGQAGNVFDLPVRSQVWKTVDQWGKDAGLDKHLHYHMSRHTFATMLLEKGEDIYTVAKLLGVTLATAQRYAKVVDKTKVAAVNKIPEFTFN